MASNRMKAILGKFTDIRTSSGGSAHVVPKKKAAGNAWSAVQITIVSGTDLAPKDLNGKSDPYVKVIANGHLRHKTAIIKANLFPNWDTTKEVVQIPYSSALKMVDLECWDWDRVGSDDFMGECSIDMADLKVGVETEMDLKLTVFVLPPHPIPFHWFTLPLAQFRLLRSARRRRKQIR